jgi:hypothetical protein
MENIDKIRNDINNILLNYQYEFNTPDIRLELASKIGQYLDREIVDRTTQQLVDNNTYNLAVKIEDKEYSIFQYLTHLKLIQSFELIFKINSKKRKTFKNKI